MLSEAVARALGGGRAAQAGCRPGHGEAPLVYTRVIGLCRLVGEERVFRAAFSRSRSPVDDAAGGTVSGTASGTVSGTAGGTVNGGPPPGDGDAGGCCEGDERCVWVLELDVDEVIRDALDDDAPVSRAPVAPRV
ncbi:hypothetical protein DQ384_01795 [Sphaerisporangium album]|uniref:Uncharacterized protein n=2 Tax=Sphaerisporangium album TaxID=509200 RepID=A0A367FSI6_9ACTN|nr:hypothetical protein DQ384_01795 [Sphaerisporangium album]